MFVSLLRKKDYLQRVRKGEQNYNVIFKKTWEIVISRSSNVDSFIRQRNFMKVFILFYIIYQLNFLLENVLELQLFKQF
jgi:hypothetical protein